MNGNDLQKHMGLTARHVSYWTGKGYIKPVDPNPGSGKPLEFPDSEVAIATVMLALVTAGVNAKAAHTLARDPVAGAEELRRLANVVQNGGLS